MKLFMKKKWLVFLPFLLIACKVSQKQTTSLPTGTLVVHGKLWGSLFQQRAAEYRALCLQAYNIARFRTEQVLQQPLSRPRAIITDIDETFLDNSPYAVHQGLAGKDYEPATWNEWTSLGAADTLQGALTFFKFAASNNIEIFYVTNREEKERAGTLANLKRFGFPHADNEHLILKQAESTKEPRRLQIAKKYDIILLLGDNLSDFSGLFDKKTEAERNRQVNILADEFGKRFIMLPNFTYGGWEDAIYLNSRQWTPPQKDSLVKAALKAY